jgi:hypothetical protein
VARARLHHPQLPNRLPIASEAVCLADFKRFSQSAGIEQIVGLESNFGHLCRHTVSLARCTELDLVAWSDETAGEENTPRSPENAILTGRKTGSPAVALVA